MRGPEAQLSPGPRGSSPFRPDTKSLRAQPPGVERFPGRPAGYSTTTFAFCAMGIPPAEAVAVTTWMPGVLKAWLTELYGS